MRHILSALILLLINSPAIAADVASFDVRGFRLYMTPDEALTIAKKLDPNPRIGREDNFQQLVNDRV